MTNKMRIIYIITEPLPIVDELVRSTSEFFSTQVWNKKKKHQMFVLKSLHLTVYCTKDRALFLLQ